MIRVLLAALALIALGYGLARAGRALRRQVRHWRVGRMLDAIHRQAYHERGN